MMRTKILAIVLSIVSINTAAAQNPDQILRGQGQYRWADGGFPSMDWVHNDYAITKGDIPKRRVGNTPLCENSDQLARVVSCFDNRPDGYPPVPADRRDFDPAKEKPPRWCTYKTNNINLFTPHTGLPPARVYVCSSIAE
jgi:hypothetical protein